MRTIVFRNSRPTFNVTSYNTSTTYSLGEFIFYGSYHTKMTFFLNVVPMLIMTQRVGYSLSFLRLKFLGARGVNVYNVGVIRGSFLCANTRPIGVP